MTIFPFSYGRERPNFAFIFSNENDSSEIESDFDTALPVFFEDTMLEELSPRKTLLNHLELAFISHDYKKILELLDPSQKFSFPLQHGDLSFFLMCKSIAYYQLGKYQEAYETAKYGLNAESLTSLKDTNLLRTKKFFRDLIKLSLKKFHYLNHQQNEELAAAYFVQVLFKSFEEGDEKAFFQSIQKFDQEKTFSLAPEEESSIRFLECLYYFRKNEYQNSLIAAEKGLQASPHKQSQRKFESYIRQCNLLETSPIEETSLHSKEEDLMENSKEKDLMEITEKTSTEYSLHDPFPFPRNRRILSIYKEKSNQTFYHELCKNEKKSSKEKISSLESYLTVHYEFLREKTPRYLALFLSKLANFYFLSRDFQKAFLISKIGLESRSMTDITRKNLVLFHNAARTQIEKLGQSPLQDFETPKTWKIRFPNIYVLKNENRRKMISIDEMMEILPKLNHGSSESATLIRFLWLHPEIETRPDDAVQIYYGLASNLAFFEHKYNEAKAIAETGIKFNSKHAAKQNLIQLLEDLKKNSKSYEEIIPSNPLSYENLWKLKTFEQLEKEVKNLIKENRWKFAEETIATFIGHQHQKFLEDPELGGKSYTKLVEAREKCYLYPEALKAAKLGLALKNLPDSIQTDLKKKKEKLEKIIAEREQDAPEIITGEKENTLPKWARNQ